QLLRGLGAIRRGRAARRGPGLELAPVERFGPEVQRIDAARPRAGWFPRDHDELNWAMDHPWLAEARHLAFHLVRDGEITGYALARVREFEGLRLGSLLRAGVLPGVAGGEDALVAGLVGHLDDERVDIADVCTANARLLAAAGRLGMLERPGIEIACRFDPETRAALERAGTRFEDFEGDYGEGDVIFA
ncbi:MAG: hypothetical protein JWM73_729, partial [Solirubrobacterales bacterium]|nr:hypothetical protein [Solirubrobacterales bacterium]